MINNGVLKLDNQVCFPLYAASRLVTRMYQPLLEKLDLTYPQYLILLVLWENDGLTVKRIGERLHLESNTLTPLLKRMEAKSILIRKRSEKDERKVVISLTESGSTMKEKALCIPGELIKQLPESYSQEKLEQIRESIKELIKIMQKK